MSELTTYADAWRQACQDFLRLLSELDPDDWRRSTDCPGWTVHDVVAHVASLERELADHVRQGDIADGSRDVVTTYTKIGVDARRGHSPDQLVAELTDAVGRRCDQLAAAPPTDPAGRPDHTPGGIDWDWRTLLRNRTIDVWVHEQDIRRATGRPGGMSSPGADLVAATFGAAFPYVIGKRAGADPGTTVVVEIDGTESAYAVDDSGRCRSVDELPAGPSTRLSMDRETLTILGAGRRDPADVQVEMAGDQDLGLRILHGMAVTP
ncbi:MAG: maleylpyruvate isomerase family mycothiol-dependent enzyme [Propionibacteriales bacterium]|nr:maleylpyruvate isomerase family mycothiol-dependent enzyme [Propionibacteriales bacterium]